MKTRIFAFTDLFIIFFSAPYIVLPQVNLDWAEKYGFVSVTCHAKSITVDNFENVYVTGTCGGMTTIKYNKSGDVIWVRDYQYSVYSGGYATSIAVDKNKNVYTLGHTQDLDDYLLVTLKYNEAGRLLWTRTYGGQFQAGQATKIMVDGECNVYVCGYKQENSQNEYDYITIKYDSNGNQQWMNRYNGPGNGMDITHDMDTDKLGNIYVTGMSVGPDNYYDYATIKFSSNGSVEWIQRYNGTGNFNDAAYSVDIDKFENVYVTGGSTGLNSEDDFVTIKYNSSGTIIWSERYNGSANAFDRAYSISIDHEDNAIVTGSSAVINASAFANIVTIKYNSEGVIQWHRQEDCCNTQIINVENISQILDSQSNIYIASIVENNSLDKDFKTFKYNSNGDLMWDTYYGGKYNSVDISNGITLDRDGNVFVTGIETYIDSGNYNFQFVTLKYSQPLTIIQSNVSSPDNFSLLQNYPNPFNPVTHLEFGISNLGFVSLKVYDVLGNEVKTLVNENKPAGNYKVEFDGSNFPSGIYFYKLEARYGQAGSFVETKRMIMIK